MNEDVVYVLGSMESIHAVFPGHSMRHQSINAVMREERGMSRKKGNRWMVRRGKEDRRIGKERGPSTLIYIYSECCFSPGDIVLTGQK